MPEITGNSKFISKVNSGFPPHLDWEKLRAIGLDHIGKLSGKLWTDHNVHDPGITTLEILCYALMDLGYRTNLPISDILARDPDKPGKEDNFFTPAQILSCNPVTITDFRKMLIDIPGVRNAWLDDSFYPCSDEGNKSFDKKETLCSDCYNGLYRVYIETERDNTDPASVEVRDLMKKIRKKLMAHRNLCEDFVDVRILCKKKVGLCADIELEKDADVERVYQDAVNRLIDFFSPAPKFYTLRQLLVEREKTIEEIFAGRPYDLKESHGFVDSEELDKLQLRKEIHFSDIYQILLGVPGVRNASRLAWRKDGQPCLEKAGWTFNIPKDHVLQFSPEASMFTFIRQGIPVSFDAGQFNELFRLNLSYSGKVSYRSPSPYLDLEMPTGVFRSDLGEYQSVQNEFPRVYGINPGGLPASSSDRRRAQAYQLKGYLLFFDQLLSNYLAQLQNIRPLFSFSSAIKSGEKRTYFINSPDEVPDIGKLLRFNGSNGSANIPGIAGSVLARPVQWKELEKSISNGKLSKSRCEEIAAPYYYKEYCARELAVKRWQQDLFFGEGSPVVFSINPRCWMFYLVSPADPDVVLLGSRTYSSESEARQAGESTLYAGGYTENFNVFEDAGLYSFAIQLRMSDYLQYLQGMIENESLYLERRGQFLDHLLSRFAERFTDFALLSFAVSGEGQVRQQEILHKEKFLQHYPGLSSNRGKAYDYLRNGWNNENLSGFEKRAMAIAGMGTLKRKHLCNYVVEKFEEYYQIVIKLANGDILFKDPEKFYSRESAELALKDLLQAITRWENYSVVPDNTPYTVKISFGEGKYALYTKEFDSKDEAVRCRKGWFRMMQPAPEESDVIDNKIVLRPNLQDIHDATVARCTLTFNDESVFRDHVRVHPDFFQESANWTRFAPYPEGAEMIYDEEHSSLVNWSAFTFYSRRNILRKPGKFGYELLDSENMFRLFSDIPHDSEMQAEQSARGLLRRIAFEPDCLLLVEDNAEYHLEVKTGDAVQVKTEETKDRREILQLKASIIRIIRANVYPIVFIPEASTWKFRFVAGHEAEHFVFTSVDEYHSPAEALVDATLFFQSVNNESLQVEGRTLSLAATMPANKSIVAKHEVEDEGRVERTRQRIQDYLSLRREIRSDLGDPDALGEKYIINDIGDARRQWVYRLVDKDNLLAFYKPAIDQNERKSVEQKRKELYQNPPAYEFTEILLSEDSIVSTGQEKKIPKFYYRIVRRQDGGHDLVLFESVRRYRSSEEAWDAFLENYLTILNKARYRENYGKGKVISLEPVPYDADGRFEDTATLVYIPESTKEFYSWYDNLAIEGLVKIANQYPIRYTTKEEDEFYELFKCEEDNRPKPIAVCPTPKEGKRYYYFVLTDKDGVDLWQGNHFYASRQEAVDQFRFFLDLLKYPGNFIIQRDYCECQSEIGEHLDKPCVCRWKVWIREVLAESKTRFVSQADAWSDLEQFICVAQSEGSFHAFQRAEDCSHTFDIMCRSGLIHPVAYHSEKDRNESIIELHKAFEEFTTRRFPTLQVSNNGWHLIDSRNEVIADVTMFPGRYRERLCLADIFHELFDNLPHYKETGIDLKVLLGPSNFTETLTVKPHDPNIDLFEWAKLLHIAANQYPIIKKERGKYYVVIHLPGFGLMDVDGNRRNASTCNRYAPAWEGLCCFDNCREADEYLSSVKKCLSELSHYRGVYDCECGPYRIELLCDCENDDKDKIGKVRDTEVRSTRTHIDREEKEQSCCNEIIAYNPQRYRTPKINCTAIARAKALINSEGLHLVEHILLRPRCPEDCRNNEFPKLTTCTDNKVNLTDEKIEWRATWRENAVDNSSDAIGFLPGKDPYSFIASVFLPGWPQRFRSAENRLIVENLLYRETPAHIMLRIFWLRPHDFCAFESSFKHWHVWLSQGMFGHCLEEDPTRQLVQLLINTKFEDMEACMPCSPCKPPPAQEGCFEDEEDPCEGVTVFQKINDLYCWENGRELAVKQQKISQEKVEVTPPGQGAAPPDIQEKQAVLNRRLMRYKSQIKTNTDINKNPLARETELFLNKAKPDVERFVVLARKILKKESPDGTKVKMDRAEQQTLFETLVFFYLDKVIFYGKKGMAGKPLQDFFSSVPRKVNKEQLFERWEPGSLASIEGGITVDEVREIVTGKSRI